MNIFKMLEAKTTAQPPFYNFIKKCIFLVL